MPHQTPTPFEGLNAVLAHFVAELPRVLGDNFVGAYLQGSFAVGDADEHSDCDFIVVLNRDLEPGEWPALEALHDAVHALPQEPWNHRLEGSYVPAAILRRLSPEPRDPPGEPRAADWADPGLGGAPARVYPLVYLDHGARRLARSEHDNTQVVRWSLREKGVTLAGPPPRTLIDPVSAEMLRAEVARTLELVIALDLEPMPMKAWQAFYVGLACRILHTLATGQVHSKRAGTAWALAHLDPEWHGLIARAQATKEGDRESAMQPPEPDEAAATRAFARYALDKARHEARARELIAQQLAAKRAGGRGGNGGWGGGPRSEAKARPAYTPPPFRSHDRGKRG